MAKFPTYAVLSVSTGRLLGELGPFYGVFSFLIGRPAFTHELSYYGERASVALRASIPGLPGADDAQHVNGDNYRSFLSGWEKQLGGVEIDLPDSLRDCLADDRNAVETATDMVGVDRVQVVKR